MPRVARHGAFCCLDEEASEAQTKSALKRSGFAATISASAWLPLPLLRDRTGNVMACSAFLRRLSWRWCCWRC